jgi:hypothetical protein
VKKENPETARQWKEAIRELGKEDHYISVLWGEGILAVGYATERPPHDFLKLVGAALLVVTIAVVVGVAASRYRQMPMPVWLKRVLISLFVGSYIYFAVAPLLTKKSPGVQRMVDEILRIAGKEKPRDIAGSPVG